MSGREPPKYVVDDIMGDMLGQFLSHIGLPRPPPADMDTVFGPQSMKMDTTEEEQERVWPLIPIEHDLPPSHLEEVVKEGK